MTFVLVRPTPRPLPLVPPPSPLPPPPRPPPPITHPPSPTPPPTSPPTRPLSQSGLPRPPSKSLASDIGGAKMKVLLSGEVEPRKAPSGPTLTHSRMVELARELASDWEYEAVSIGVPCPVGDDGPRSEPGNLGPGWVGFPYAAAFERPVKAVNNAAMQALGSYQGGRMLFLGLGTGLGGALIAERVLVTLELGRLPFRSRAGATLGEAVGRAGRKRLGKEIWRRVVARVVARLHDAFLVDD